MANKFVLNQEDGTVEGGDVRGIGAVDLQMSRTSADQVASGNYSVILGGARNKIASGTSIFNAIVGGYNNQILSNSTNRSYNYIGGGIRNIINDVGNGNSNTISGGFENTITGERSVIGGGINNVHNNSSYSTISGGRTNTSSSAYNTISGGLTNTASTNTHATVVGGYQNSSTGQYSVSGGYSNTASGQGAVALGYNGTASGIKSIAIGGVNVSGDESIVISSGTVSGNRSFSFRGDSDGDDSVNFFSSRVDTPRSAGIGSGNQLLSFGFDSFAFGQNNYLRSKNTVSIGYSNSNPLVGGDAGQYRMYLGVGCTSSTYTSGDPNNPKYSLAKGLNSKTNLWGQETRASGAFSSSGDSQISQVISRKEDTLTTGSTTELFLDGSSELIVPDGTNRVWNVTVETQAVVTNTNGTSGIAAGDVYSEVSKLTFKKIGGLSSLVGIISRQFVFDGGMGTAQMNYSAGASQELAIEFQAPAFGAGDITVRVVSKVSLVEVAY